MNVEPISFNQLGLWMSIAFLVYALHLKREANEIARKAAEQAKANGDKPQNTVITPQPLSVELVKQFATKEQVDKQIGDLKQDVDKRLEHIEATMNDRLTTIDNKRDRQVSELHTKINEANATLNYIRGKLDCLEK